MNHVHVSFVHFLITVAYMVLFGFLARAWAMSHPDSKLSKGLAVTVL